jgi:hypothetical protein
MKIYCISWKDERWTADEKALKNINQLINQEKRQMNKIQKILEVFFMFLGWVFVAPRYIINILKCKFKK